MKLSNNSLVNYIANERSGMYNHVIEVDSTDSIENIIESIIEEYTDKFTAQSIINFFSTLEVMAYSSESELTSEQETEIHDFNVNAAVTEALEKASFPIFDLSQELDLDLEELTTEIVDCESQDFEIGDYRFITKESIDTTQQEELSNDPYVLGCFNANFLAYDVLDLPIEVIEALQEVEKYEVLGQMIIDKDLIETLQEQYASADGYGHHFAHYDHNEHEITLNDTEYYYFKVN